MKLRTFSQHIIVSRCDNIMFNAAYTQKQTIYYIVTLVIIVILSAG